MVPPAYGVSKSGVISLTRIGAIEHARDGIRVNCIAPGYFDTGLGALADSEHENTRKKIFQEVIERDIPMGRQAQPKEIKGLAVFLASEASSYVTGQVLFRMAAIWRRYDSGLTNQNIWHAFGLFCYFAQLFQILNSTKIT